MNEHSRTRQKQRRKRQRKKNKSCGLENVSDVPKKRKKFPRRVRRLPDDAEITFAYWNVNGFDYQKIDVMAISETHHRQDVPRERFAFTGFKVWHADRGGLDKGGGGLSLYYKENLHTHEYRPAVGDAYLYLDNERQWLLVESNGSKIAFLSCYLACASSGPNDHEKWNSDMYTMLIGEVGLLRSRGFAIIALGDFNARIGQIPGLENNIPSLNSNAVKFKNFVNVLDLTILNTLPISKGLFTHFCEREGFPFSQSILDYGISDSSLAPFITSFIIDSEARIDCGSDHALLVTSIKFSNASVQMRSTKSDVLTFKLPPDQDYSSFHKKFSESQTLPTLEAFEKLDVNGMAKTLTHTLFDTCCHTFLDNKRIKFKKRRKYWLPPNLVKHIKVRRLLQSRLFNLRSQENADNSQKILITKMETLLRLQRFRVRQMLGDLKHARAGRIRNRILMNDTTVNNFWKFVKQHCKAMQSIGASYNDAGDVVFGHDNVAPEVVSKWSGVFSGQTEPVFPDSSQPPLPDLDSSHPLLHGLPYSSPDKHEEYLCRPFTMESLTQILSELQEKKSSGLDNIPSEVLKYSNDTMKQYLLTFYNKILEEGTVPECLNVIKCVLLHKTGDSLDMLNYRHGPMIISLILMK